MQALLCVDWERFCNPHSCTAVMEHASAEICESTLTFKAWAWSLRVGATMNSFLQEGPCWKIAQASCPQLFLKKHLSLLLPWWLAQLTIHPKMPDTAERTFWLFILCSKRTGSWIALAWSCMGGTKYFSARWMVCEHLNSYVYLFHYIPIDHGSQYTMDPTYILRSLMCLQLLHLPCEIVFH